MKLRGIAFLAVRLVSVYLFILGLNHLINLLEFALPTYLQIKSNISYGDVLLMIGLPASIMIIAGIILWVFADSISKRLVPGSLSEVEAEGESGYRSSEMEGFILSVVGLILLILSSTRLISLLINYVNIRGQGVTFNEMGHVSTLAEQLIRIIIGIMLLLQAESFARWLRKLRNKQE
ncbi:hypothetical protein [Paenibacillus dakarensis]|uniref:hypothetical protein n=1 Tax=Paenibacillus dakarensis TaxID=1527293 RepID=UPI0006D52CFA|nr:hypothetical protein [Paenibacillus dakarensis]